MPLRHLLMYYFKKILIQFLWKIKKKIYIYIKKINYFFLYKNFIKISQTNTLKASVNFSQHLNIFLKIVFWHFFFLSKCMFQTTNLNGKETATRSKSSCVLSKRKPSSTLPHHVGRNSLSSCIILCVIREKTFIYLASPFGEEFSFFLYL